MIHTLNTLDAEAIICLFDKTDAFRNPERFEKLLIVCEADARGVGADRSECSYQQAQSWRYLLREVIKIDAKEFVAQGYKGNEIRVALHARRVEHINNTWINHEK